LPRIDARTHGSRRFRALVRACIAEIGGDTTGLSELDRLAVSQAAALMMQVEEAQAILVAGGRCDPDVLIRASSECRRSLEVLREKAVKNRPAAPSLAEFLAQRAAQSDEEDEA
jgi:hypothetical protein